jgi:hypothetical protein
MYSNTWTFLQQKQDISVWIWDRFENVSGNIDGIKRRIKLNKFQNSCYLFSIIVYFNEVK